MGGDTSRDLAGEVHSRGINSTTIRTITQAFERPNKLHLVICGKNESLHERALGRHTLLTLLTSVTRHAQSPRPLEHPPIICHDTRYSYPMST